MTVQITRLSESFAYQAKRQALLDAEQELAVHREKVAALRRDLPADTVIGDYQLEDARTGQQVGLSDLVDDRPLLVYHLMYGKAQTSPCPMCSMWIDGLNAASLHVARKADLIVVAAADPDDIAAHAAARGWDRIPLYSSRKSAFKFDLGSEGENGEQHPQISTIVRRGGDLVHLYSSRPELSDSMRERGLDLLSPVWHLLDLTPDGRGDWYPELAYDE